MMFPLTMEIQIKLQVVSGPYPWSTSRLASLLPSAPLGGILPVLSVLPIDSILLLLGWTDSGPANIVEILCRAAGLSASISASHEYGMPKDNVVCFFMSISYIQ